jgi:GAF domain-containing protein
VQAIQQQYVRAAWTRYASSAEVRGFRFRDGAVEHDNDAWLGAMTQAVQQKSTASRPQELALPVTLRGQVIGALGMRRDASTRAEWGEEELALAQSITDQLAETIEGLRLLDETQRRAAREQLTRRVVDQMRRAPDMDSLMQTTLREMRAALGASGGYVQLAYAPESAPHATEAGQ